MRINIVTETEGQRWILRPWSEALARELPNTQVRNGSDPNADVNFFINYALYHPVPTLTMAMFTHREHDGRREVFDKIAQAVNWCFAQSKITAALLPSEKTSILCPGLTNNAFYKRPLVLGVVGRSYPSGRKRMNWTDDLRQIPGVEVRVSGGKIPSANMPAFYRGLDYLVILSDNEGGPVVVLEAMAMGKPVIAPNVGYCWEYPVLRYSTKAELLAIVQKLVISQNLWKQAASTVLGVLQKLNKV